MASARFDPEHKKFQHIVGVQQMPLKVMSFFTQMWTQLKFTGRCLWPHLAYEYRSSHDMNVYSEIGEKQHLTLTEADPWAGELGIMAMTNIVPKILGS